MLAPAAWRSSIAPAFATKHMSRLANTRSGGVITVVPSKAMTAIENTPIPQSFLYRLPRQPPAALTGHPAAQSGVSDISLSNSSTLPHPSGTSATFSS